MNVHAVSPAPLPIPSPKIPKPRDFLPPLDVNQRYSVDESLAYLRISRGTLFGDIREGRLKVIREGKRTYVPGSEIARRSSLNSADVVMNLPKSADIIIAYGQYYCSGCGQALRFEYSNSTTRMLEGSAIASCEITPSCPMHGKRLRIQLLHLKCEVLPDA